MKRWISCILIIGFIGCSTSGWIGTQTVRAAKKIDVAALKVAATTDKLVLVIGTNGYKVNVSYHTKGSDGIWTEVFATPGVYGKTGGTENKKEGDGKTPIGTYSFTLPFGLKDNPGSTMPYHKIKKGDYWVDDSNSKYYNKLVNTRTTPKIWKSAEDMSAQSPYYNYALALDYNEDAVPGKGSAIFLHCTKSDKDTGSAGCIRIPQKLVKHLVQTIDEKSKIIIVSNIDQLECQ